MSVARSSSLDRLKRQQHTTTTKEEERILSLNEESLMNLNEIKFVRSLSSKKKLLSRHKGRKKRQKKWKEEHPRQRVV